MKTVFFSGAVVTVTCQVLPVTWEGHAWRLGWHSFHLRKIVCSSCVFQLLRELMQEKQESYWNLECEYRLGTIVRACLEDGKKEERNCLVCFFVFVFPDNVSLCSLSYPGLAL